MSEPSTVKRVAMRGVEPARRLLVYSGIGPVDTWMAAALVALIGFGVAMVYSASAFEATVRFGDAQYYVRRQAIYAVLALITMWVASRFDYHHLRKLTYPALGVVVIMLGLTISGFGHRAGNAYRWLSVGPIHIQPAETAKVVLVWWLAYSLAKKGARVKSFMVGFVPHMLMVGVLIAMCMKQPDFGSSVVLLLITFTLLFIAGVPSRYLVSFLALFSVIGFAAVRTSTYRWGRMLSWMNMEQHRQGLAYQPFQSVMSFGSGEITGLGLGRGLQVLYLPEAHTDFVAAIIGEELGFIGISCLIGVYLLIVGRGVKVALSAQDDYGAYIAFGLSALLAMQVLTNLSVAMALLPTKGLTLPFVSYGGSSLLVSAGAMGIILNISRRRPPVVEAKKKRAMEPEGPAQSASAVVVTSAEEGAAGW